MPGAKTRNVVCPECGKEATLTADEDGVYQGRCKNEDCGLDVGWVFEKRRRDKAVDKLKKDEEGENAPQPRNKRGRFSFGS